jgi:peptidoglycan hydrolase-like protein with peptidoglycan-binding domain
LPYPVFRLPADGSDIFTNQGIDSPPSGDSDNADFTPPPEATGDPASGNGDVENYAEEFEWLDPESLEMSYEWTDEVSRSSPEYVRWLQQSLNKILGLRLAVDGISGTQTRSAVRSFQQRARITVDGIVGPQTEASLIKFGASLPPGYAGTPATQPSYGGSVPSYGGGIPTIGGSRPKSGVSPIGINTPLPSAGPGFFSYTTSAKRFGLSKTIQAILAVAAAWQHANPRGPRLGIGNISLQGGGPFPPHSSHQKGVDVDIRPVRNDRKEEPVTYQSASYSRALTQQLVDIIRANGVLSIRTILFNDPNVRGVSPYPGHDDHLHVSFNAT